MHKCQNIEEPQEELKRQKQFLPLHAMFVRIESELQSCTAKSIQYMSISYYEANICRLFNHLTLTFLHFL